ncbi:MAG: hypothetical protein JKY70_10960 [Mucilaginibacter sp.]|nr:hypothetical protein [Mucilaginibacter sp.]
MADIIIYIVSFFFICFLVVSVIAFKQIHDAKKEIIIKEKIDRVHIIYKMNTSALVLDDLIQAENLLISHPIKTSDNGKFNHKPIPVRSTEFVDIFTDENVFECAINLN